MSEARERAPIDAQAWAAVSMGRARTRWSDARAAERAPNGHAVAADSNGVASVDAVAVPRSVHRRRQTALLARRRRIALLDTILGALVGVLVLALGFGLAPVGMVALLVLVACAVSYARGRRRARRP